MSNKKNNQAKSGHVSAFIENVGLPKIIFVFILLVLLSLSTLKLYNAFATVENLFDLTTYTYQEWFFSVPWFVDTKGIALTFAVDLLVLLILYSYYLDHSKNTKYGAEHGTAKWGKPKQVNKALADFDNEFNNVILTDNLRFKLTSRDLPNYFVLVIGGSGAGKTRYYVKPNLLQKNGSYIVLDPKGELTRDTAYMFQNDPEYTVHILDLRELETSEHYNPFVYIQSDADIQALASSIIANCSGEKKGNNSGDPYWDSAATNLLSAIFYHLWHDAQEEDQTFGRVMDILRIEKLDDDQGTTMSPLDEYFWDCYQYRQDELAYRYYINYQQAPGKTRASILSVLTSKLQKFNLEDMERMTHDDELDFRTMGEKKTVLYIIVPDNDSSFNFIVGMLYTQLFQVLTYQADYVNGGSLPLRVHFLMDEFANVAIPNDFSKLMSTVRSRNIACSIIVQGVSQIKNLFPNDIWDNILGNCATWLYLGNNEDSTHKMISERLGQETVYAKSTSNSKGQSSSSSSSEQVTGSNLLTQAQVSQFQIDHPNSAIVMIQNQLPVIDTKYNLNRHPNIDFTVDGKLGKELSYSHKFTPSDLALTEVKRVTEDFDPDRLVATIDCRTISEAESFTGKDDDFDEV